VSTGGRHIGGADAAEPLAAAFGDALDLGPEVGLHALVGDPPIGAGAAVVEALQVHAEPARRRGEGTQGAGLEVEAARAEAGGGEPGRDDLRGWPQGALAALEWCGALRETGLASAAGCDGCDDACIEETIVLGEREGTRAFVACSRRADMGRVDVPLERLRR
jgi:hypothetical protein